MEGLLGCKEAADFLKISVRDLRRLCQRRQISFFQITRRKRCFSREQLEDYLARVTVSAREKKFDRSGLTPVQFPRKGGEQPSLQGDSGKGFSDIRKELNAL